MDQLMQKLDQLKNLIRSYGRVLVAFSGGCDSALVLTVARQALGRENVLAVIAQSPSLPSAELNEARDIARRIDAELLEIQTREIENPHYASNPAQRCYFCKSTLYTELVPIAEGRGFGFLLNGTNCDDLGDWRPGLKAAEEYRIKSPLVEAGFTKEEIREASRLLGLATWSKPQAACLSSRIPFGTPVTLENLRQVEEGEELLKGEGFHTVRLRWFGKRALIEVGTGETQAFFQDARMRERILSGLKTLGFERIDLNLEGYKTGNFSKSVIASETKQSRPEIALSLLRSSSQ